MSLKDVRTLSPEANGADPMRMAVARSVEAVHPEIEDNVSMLQAPQPLTAPHGSLNIRRAPRIRGLPGVGPYCMLRYYLALVLTLWLAWTGPAAACADPPRANFRDIVGAAPTIFVFQLVSANYVREDLGSGAWTERVEGRIRVIESLKGDGRSFQRITYSFRSCGSVRMSVGQFYLVATSQKGPTIQLWGIDQALLDLTLDFYGERKRQSPAVEIVRKIVAGMAVPADFPRPELEEPLHVYPVPPPPPAPVIRPNNSFKPKPLRGSA